MVNCGFCGKTLERRPSDLNVKPFCNSSCLRKFEAQQRRGPLKIEESVVYIPLQDGNYAMVDRADWDSIAGLRELVWTSVKPSKKSEITYAVSYRGKEFVLMHRVILGLTEKHEKTDHIDFNGLNNKRDNIRLATHAQNMQHKRSFKKGVEYRGVKKVFNRYRVMIQDDFIGSYETAIEAAKAYNRVAKERFGDFAILNEIPDGM